MKHRWWGFKHSNRTHQTRCGRTSAANLLHQTTDHFLDAANYVVDVAWKPDWKITSKQKLHDQTYYDVRDESPLPANLVQAARNRAAEAVKGCVERWKKGKESLETTLHVTVRQLRRKNRHGQRRPRHARHHRRASHRRFHPPDERRDTPHSAYLFNDDYDVNGSHAPLR